jgi:hypothetical protein
MSLFDRIAQGTLEDDRTTRGVFLKKLAKFGVGATAAIAALVRPGVAAATRYVACCTLASDYDCACRACCATGCSEWAWYCRADDGRVWECGECYTTEWCSNACSWAYVGGLSPAG